MKRLDQILNFRYIYPAAFRNAILILLGASFYALAFKTISPIPLIISLLMFIVGYPAIHIFNDILDLRSNVKEKPEHELDRKHIAKGKVNFEQSASLMFLLLILSFALSFFLNRTVQLLFLVSVLANVMYSSAYTRWKDKGMPLAPTALFVMQLSKILIGWFSQTSSWKALPLSGAIFIASAYAFSYFIIEKGRLPLYSVNVNGVKMKRKIEVKEPFAVLISVLLFIISLTILIIYFPYKTLTILIVVASIITTILYYFKASSVYSKSILKVMFICVLFLCWLFYANSDLPASFDKAFNDFMDQFKLGEDMVSELSYFGEIVEISKGISNQTIIRVELKNAVD